MAEGIARQPMTGRVDRGGLPRAGYGAVSGAAAC